jgi:hypothetical protein
MRHLKASRVLNLFALLAAVWASSVHGQIQKDATWNGARQLDPSIKRTYIPLGPGTPGVLYEPVNPGAKSHLAVVVMHGGDYLTFPTCFELSQRGYRVLCANPVQGAGDAPLLSVKLAVAYARSYPGVQKVVLFGHSGGGVLMSTYQNIAENGLKACQGPEKIYKCSDSVANLPAADGLILEDANWGIMGLLSLDPAVINYDNGVKINPEFDLFNPANGFNPKGSDYSQEFIHKFQTEVARKYNELVKRAQERLADIQAGKGRFADDEPFPLASGGSGVPNNKLFAQDVKLMSHTNKPWPLIHSDGSVTTEVVHTVRVPENPKSTTEYLGMGGSNGTVRSFLRTAVRVNPDFSYDESSIHGVDWNSNYTNPIGNSAGIHVPLLFVGNTGHWEYLVGESVYEHSASKDKSLAFMEGAFHSLNTCAPCEKYPGQYGDTIKPLFDYMDHWLSQNNRFIKTGQ